MSINVLVIDLKGIKLNLFLRYDVLELVICNLICYFFFLSSNLDFIVVEEEFLGFLFFNYK